MDHAKVAPETYLTKPERDCNFLPMHRVVKESSSTTKLRIVFDQSAVTTSGNSQNNSLIARMDPAIPDLLIKFRTLKIAMTADIHKMFVRLDWISTDLSGHLKKALLFRLPQ